MERRIKLIEKLYLYIPLIFLLIATYGTISQLFRITPDFRSDLLPSADVLQNLVHNIYQAPILDLIIQSPRRMCPLNYFPRAIATWPGTNEGMFNQNNKTLFQGTSKSLKIPQDQIGKDWIHIPSQPMRNFQNWGAYQLCAFYGNSRSVNFNTSECPLGFKLCSKGTICVLQHQPCPLTSVNFEWHPSGYELKLKTQRNNSQSPIIFIETSINGLPCLNPRKAHPLSKNTRFPLESNPSTGCDKFGEYKKESIEVIDEEPLSQFYTENNLPLMEISPLEYAKYLEGSNILLLAKKKEEIAIKLFCGSTVSNLDIIVKRIKEFSFEGTMVASLLAYHLAVLIFGYVMLCFLFFDKENEERDKYIKQQKHVFNAFHFIPYILCLLFIAEYSEIPEVASPKVLDIQTHINIILNNECLLNNQYNLVLADLKNDLFQMNDYYFGMSQSMGVTSYLFILLMLIIRGVRGYYAKEIEEYETSFLEARFDMIRGQESVIDPTALNQVQIELPHHHNHHHEIEDDYDDEQQIYQEYLQYVQHNDNNYE